MKKPKPKTPQSQLKWTAKYQKSNTTTFLIRFYNKTDKKIIEYFKSIPNKTDFVRKAIDKELEKK